MAHKFFIRSVSLSLLTISSAFAQDLPRSMGALGDSITAGAVANYRRDQVGLIAPVILTQLIASIAAGNFRAVEARGYSWSSGRNIFKPVLSHAHRLNALRKGQDRLKVYNAAVSGAISSGVSDEQVGKLQQWSRDHLDAEFPDYVTVLIGANDICQDSVEKMTPTSDYANRMAYVVDTILEKSPDSKVLLSALPRIHRLREVAHDAKHLGIAPMRTCGEFWKTVNLCHTLTQENDPVKVQMVADRVREYNEVLADLAASRSELHGDRVHYAGAVFEKDFTADDLSIDCFHPGPSGQSKLADLTWQASWWK